MDAKLMSDFEAFVLWKKGEDDREVMEDFVVHNLDILCPSEVAQAIREGITDIESIERKARID